MTSMVLSHRVHVLIIDLDYLRATHFFIKHIRPLLTDNKALLCYNPCQSLWDSQSMSNLCPIPALYTKLPALYINIFLPSSTVLIMYAVQVPIDRLRSVTNDSARAMHGWEGKGRVMQMAKKLYGCARKIILARNLFWQAQDRSGVSVRLPVP